MEKLLNHSSFEIEILNSKLNQTITEKEVLSNQLTQVIAERDSISNQLNQTIAEKESLNSQLNYTKSVLNGIYASDFWKVACLYYKMRNRLIVLRSIHNLFKWLKRKIKNSLYSEYISKFTLYVRRHLVRTGIKESLLKINSRGYSKVVISVIEKGTKEAKGHTELFAVRSMDVQLNNFCNANCFFCVSHSKDLNPCIDLKGFETIARNVQMGTVEELILTGGEPTVNKDLDQILRFVYKEYPRMIVRLITNAINLPPNLLDSLLLGNVASVHVSINASNADDYYRIMGVNRLERVLKNIRTIIGKKKQLKLSSPEVLASLVLVKQNISNVVPFVVMGHELGLNSVAILNANLTPELSDSSPFYDPKAVREVLQQAQKVSHDKGIVLRLPGGAVKKDSCTDPWEKTFVTVEGEVNPCCGYDFRISCDERLRGNLLKQNLQEFWYSGLYDSLRKGLTTGNPLPGCKACYKQILTES